MKEKMLYSVWGAMYILCAGLGFILQRNVFVSAMMTILAVLFFVPGAVLLYEALREKNAAAILRIRLLAIGSLVLTTLLLCITFMTAPGAKWVGDLMQILLTIFCVPLMCCGQWALSLFLWACLLFGSFAGQKKR